jgi:hypothetical protein
MPTPDEIAQELLSRGVGADDIARVNPALGERVRSGLIAPRLQAPDKIAMRGAYIKDYGDINSQRDKLGEFYPTSENLDRFHELNRQTATGGWKALPLVHDVIEKFDPQFQEMSGIASGLQGKARPVGSGATSDFEQRLYRMGVPSPEKAGPTNDSIIAYQKGVLGEQRDRLAFQEEFLRRNGSLSGSQDAWARYVSANPYTTSQGGHTRVNTQRQDWKAHFGLGGEAPAAEPPAGGKPQGWSASLPKPQLNAAMMFKGATDPMGSRQNPYVPASAAEFAKLPAGAAYIDDDGKIYTKGR